jgi:hypothetical protein
MCPDITSNFWVFISHSEFFALWISVVFQVDWIIGKAVAVGCSFSTHVLSWDVILFASLEFVVVVFHHLPSTIFPFELFNSFSFELLLFALFFFLAFHFIVCCKVFLEPLQSVNIMGGSLLRV